MTVDGLPTEAKNPPEKRVCGPGVRHSYLSKEERVTGGRACIGPCSVGVWANLRSNRTMCLPYRRIQARLILYHQPTSHRSIWL